MSQPSPSLPYARPAPLLARLLPPAGPARAEEVCAAGARVLVVPGRYCVVYVLLYGEHAVVLDLGSSSDIALAEQALASVGLGPEAVLGLVPTHLHFDHILGMDAAALAWQRPLWLGPVAWEQVQRRSAGRFPPFPNSIRVLLTWPLQGLPLPTAADWARRGRFGMPGATHPFRAPTVRLSPDAALPGLGGWRLLETPGHADDAICLYHEGAGFLVAGDTIRNYLGGEWNPLLADPQAFARSRARLEGLRLRCIFPGHGPLLRVASAAEVAPPPRWRP